MTGVPPAIADHVRRADADARRSPQSADAVGMLAMAYHANGFYDLAARTYAAADALSDGEWKWAYYHVLVNLDRGRLADIPEALGRIVKRHPDVAMAWFRLAEESFKRGNVGDAAAAYGRTLASLTSGDAAAAPRPGDKATSTPPVRRVVSLAAYVQFGLARVALQRAQAADAAQRLERLITDVPDFGPAHRILADAYRALGSEAQATKHIAHASVLRPYAPPADPMVDALVSISRHAATLLTHAALAERVGDESWKEFLIARAAEFDPQNPVVLAQLELTEGRPRAASGAVAVTQGASRAGGGAAYELETMPHGAALYSASCAVCHGESGEGTVGKAPPLSGSVRVAGGQQQLVRIIIGGFRSERSGEVFGTEMPSLKVLDDREIAAILEHVRRRWGRGAPRVELDMVRRVRRMSNHRVQPWTPAELEALR
jgi:mono/diheme cytochrome c family protein